jgi:class 3 adenylate cyclase
VARLLNHLIAYAAVNAFFVAVWVLTTGSTETLQEVVRDPTKAVGSDFWPIWPILGWGLIVVLHLGTTLTSVATGGRQARHRRREAKRRKRGREELVRGVGSAGLDIVREVGSAIDKAHEAVGRRRADGDEIRAKTPERRWVTVLFSDISDSTAHNEQLGDEEWHRILARVRGVLRGALASRGGTEVGTQGDGMLARFDSPADAVLCAIDIQSELSSARDTSGFVPDVRIGVHAGEAVHDEGDLVGRVINLAARVMDEAQPGEILVTEPVADQLVGKLELEDRGLRPLKGMAQPRHLLAVKWSGGSGT